MTPDWTVEAALQQVTDAIQKGSTLPFTTDEIRELKHFYRPGFKAQHARGADWDADQKVILPLAQKVGAAAALFTSAAAILTGSGTPTVIDPGMAMRAARVGALECQLKLDRHQDLHGDAVKPPFGPYCPIPPPGPAEELGENLELARHLADMWPLLKAVARRSEEPAALARAAG